MYVFVEPKAEIQNIDLNNDDTTVPINIISLNKTYTSLKAIATSTLTTIQWLNQNKELWTETIELKYTAAE